MTGRKVSPTAPSYFSLILPTNTLFSQNFEIVQTEGIFTNFLVFFVVNIENFRSAQKNDGTEVFGVADSESVVKIKPASFSGALGVFI